MSTFTTPISISNHTQAHLVPLRVGVESIVEPCIIVPFVLLIVGHNDLNRSCVDMMVELLYGGSDCVLLPCHVPELVLQCRHLSCWSRAALEFLEGVIGRLLLPCQVIELSPGHCLSYQLLVLCFGRGAPFNFFNTVLQLLNLICCSLVIFDLSFDLSSICDIELALLLSASLT